MKKDFCRLCGTVFNHIFIDLGNTPLANSFLNEQELQKNEFTIPLVAYVCENCFLVQLKESSSPREIFSDYAYFSSYSTSWLKHAENYVEMMLDRFHFNKKSLVIELASNDGYLLQYFNQRKINVLGIEPAANVAKVAIKNGINTKIDFFTKDLALNLKNDQKQADLIVANNVLAHVPELNNFVNGIKILLKNDGLATFEFPHLLNLIKENQFDTIYHEHFSYFSLMTVITLFKNHGLEIFDVEELSTHGGSLRLFVKHENNNNFTPTKNIKNILDKEIEAGLNNLDTYTSFSISVEKIKKDLSDFIIKCKKNEKKIVCYGAPAKGNTLLNFCNIDKTLISYVVDKNIHKQGKYLPGIHLPIKSPNEITKSKPDYLLILPWNLQNEIMEEMNFIREWGGKFVIPIPEVKIL
jgi:SAM-dependent methyltransferase|tara:strand:+ start:2083 stop:3315 length:1233 start_codon:yes stop_codon:yes gene_type:complete